MKKIFNINDISKERGIKAASAKVFCVRQQKQNTFLRLKKNMYMKKEDFRNMAIEERLAISNLLQTPSYISLLTALSYYEFTTQLVPDTIESIAIKRTKTFQIGEKTFEFFKIKPKLFFGFHKEKSFFIATPEKALLDAIYLASLGKYSIDLGGIDKEKFDTAMLKKMIKKYPKKTQKFFSKIML